ncbi:MAG: hypothetical protein P9L96_02485 [Candidatus Gygaella obscura]|nr:hypothetical protein [Candidatus Gygaella obscura]
MSKTYKLKPYLVKFIKKHKVANPLLSCRSLSTIVFKKFEIKVSKSSINTIINELDLSQPPGRRPRNLDMELNTAQENMGAFFLKAADLYLGLGNYLVDLITAHQKAKNKKELSIKNNTILYYRLVANRFLEKNTPIPQVVYQASEGIYSSKVLTSYLFRLQDVTSIYSDFIDSIAAFLNTVTGIRIEYNKGSIFLESGLKSVVFDNSFTGSDVVTIYKIRSYMKDILFKKTEPLVILSSNNMNIYQDAICNFLAASKIKAVDFIGLQNKIIEKIVFEDIRLQAIIGMFAQDFAATQDIKIKGSFKSVNCGDSKEKFIAEAEAIFTQHIVNKRVTIRAIVVRSSVLGMEEYVILTNIEKTNMSMEEVFLRFISKWPNPQDAYNQLSAEKLQGYNKREINDNILVYNKLGDDDIFDICLEILNYYFQKLFFPSNWKTKGIAFMKENFYNLPGTLKTTSNKQQISLKIKRNQPFLTEIGLACEKINQNSLKNLHKKILQIQLSFR